MHFCKSLSWHFIVLLESVTEAERKMMQHNGKAPRFQFSSCQAKKVAQIRRGFLAENWLLPGSCVAGVEKVWKTRMVFVLPSQTALSSEVLMCIFNRRDL